MTPHMAAFTDGIGGEMVSFWVDNIQRFADGEALLGAVNREEGY